MASQLAMFENRAGVVRSSANSTRAVVAKLMMAAAVAAAFAMSPSLARAASCGQTVEMARDNIVLRINGGDNSQNSREAARVRLYRAEIAAANGDEMHCWNQIWWCGYFVGASAGAAASLQQAMAGDPLRIIAERPASVVPASYQPR